MHILAVDDDPYILELLPKFAAKLGYPDVDVAASGERALAMIAETESLYDCFLIDINMPGMDGIDLCAHIRGTEAYRRTPIIMLTAMVERSFIDGAFQAGATDYATKPFDLLELGARLRSAQGLNAAWASKTADTEAVEAEKDAYGDAIEVGGRGQFLDTTAATNYLTQLSRAGLDSSQVFAVRLDRSDEIHARASRAEFRYALAEVGNALDAVLRPGGYIMTYVGGGYFMVVSRQATLVASDSIEANVQSLLDDRMTEFDDGAPLDLEVSIGNPIRPSTGELTDIEQVFQRAISRARQRSAAKQGAPRPFTFVGRKF